MIKIENIETYGWEAAIRGMRNPMNSWGKSDSGFYPIGEHGMGVEIGDNDYSLMKRLRNAGTDHRKFMRMITVTIDITAPLYWWKEFDTYKIGTVANSCSTMHKIHAKEFTTSDFSCEHMTMMTHSEIQNTIKLLNMYRDLFVNWDDRDDNTKNALLVGVFDGGRYQKKDAWWQMIQLLPNSYNQKRTVQLNYEVLANIYKSRKNHKLDEWRAFCEVMKTLPYSELITGEFGNSEA